MLNPYGRQDIDESDVDAVTQVLRSSFLTQGPTVQQFESSFSEFVGAKYASATNSATSALHLACLSIGIGPGDIVWVPAISFVATANCVLYCGATVEFIDVDPKTALISLSDLEEKLLEGSKRNRLPKAIIVVNFAGASPEIQEIRKTVEPFGIRIIEDASHAVGGQYKFGGTVGSCSYSDITIFSFHPVKIMTTGEGGMAVTNDEELHKKIYRLRSHGITRSPSEMISYLGPWYYEQLDLGFNYRMSDIQAALGLSQLKKVPEFLVKRRRLVRRYFELLESTPLGLPDQSQLDFSSWHLFIISIPVNSVLSRNQAMERLSIAGFGTNVHYIPIYRQPYYRKNVVGDEFHLPGAEEYFSKAVTLPLHTKLEITDIDKICEKMYESQGFQSIF